MARSPGGLWIMSPVVGLQTTPSLGKAKVAVWLFAP
jgi:hypothetical protein